jgi:hypothetical protein
MQEVIGGFVKTLEEFETHLNRHGWTTSREELRSKDKPLLKQTVTGRQGEFWARAVYTRRKVETDADQIHFDYTGAYLPEGGDQPRWSVFKTYDDIMRFVHEYDITLLVASGPPPTPKSHQCRCGKVRHTKAIAHGILRKSQRERRRMGPSSNRMEERVYACPTDSKVFHLTSRKHWTEETPEGREKTDGRSTGDPDASGVGAVRPADTADGVGDRAVPGKGRRQPQVPKARDRSPGRLPGEGPDGEEGDV